MNHVLRISLLMALTGCVTTSDVTPIGRDTFMVSTDARGGFTSTADLVARSAQKANAYCRAIGKEMMTDNIQNQGVRGFTPQENLRASHICGMKCHVPALEEGVETAETPGDGFRAGWLVAA